MCKVIKPTPQPIAARGRRSIARTNIWRMFYALPFEPVEAKKCMAIFAPEQIGNIRLI